MTTKKLSSAAGGFNISMMGGDLNGHCQTCGAISTIEYKGLDPIHPDFRIVCNNCGTYTTLKIRMMPKFLPPEPYRGQRLFEKWMIKHRWW